MRSLITPFVSRRWSNQQHINHKQNAAFKTQKKQNHERMIPVFLALDDPYSFLLLQALPALQANYDLEFSLHLIHNRQQDMFPEPKMWADWSLSDAAHLQALYQFELPKCSPTKQQVTAGQKTWLKHLLDTQSKQASLTLNEAFNIFKMVWNANDNSKLTSAAPLTEQQQTELLKNESLLKTFGHYLPATIFYADTWFWGLDRLEHFEQLLQRFFPEQKKPVMFNKTWCELFNKPEKQVADKTTPIQLYFSLRSPYSHLALINAQKLAQHYQVPLELKPVLPMLMRGLSVPKNKTQYIFMDTVRESKKLGIPYGNVADPLGKGVENGYALWQLAKQQGKELDFFNAFSYAVNSQGISANYHWGFKKICKTAGLDWHAAKQALKDESWRALCENNLKDMYALGLWGVPSLSYKNVHVWGQDRLFVIEQTMLETAPVSLQQES